MSFEDDRERVREATDFVALVSETVQLRQRSGEWWGCCPFHQEKSPSFKVNPSTGLWKCFGCGKGGDLFSYVMERENLDFGDALRYLADRQGIELSSWGGSQDGPKRSRVTECLCEAESFYSTMLLRGADASAAAARNYLKGRGFGSDICRRWGIGFAPGRGTLVAHLRSKSFTDQEMETADLALRRNGSMADRFYDRVMFPIHDEHGNTIAFGGRVLGDAKPKYLNSRDTKVFHKGHMLFAYDKAKEHITASKEAIICEGYTDVIAMHEAGIRNVCAVLGTALTLDHLKLLARCRTERVILVFDGDEAGQRAAERAIRYLDAASMDLRCVVLPDGLDPADYLDKHSVDELRTQMAASRPLLDFVFEKRLESVDLSVPGKRVAALDELAGLLAPLKKSVLFDQYATNLAYTLGADVEETKRLIRSKPIPSVQDGYRSQDYAQEDAPRQDTREAAGQSAQGAADESRTWEALSNDERSQLVVERDLLSMMCEHPDDVRAFSDRIASISWGDSRHEAIAWAILATPVGSTPAQCVAAARAVVQGADSLLAGATPMSNDNMDDAQKLEFLLDTIELYSTKRKIAAIRSKLNQASKEEADELFGEATALQKRVNELSSKISGQKF